MEYQEKKMELFKLATMATLKTKSPAEVGFGEALWKNYQIIESEHEAVDKRLSKREEEKAASGPPRNILA